MSGVSTTKLGRNTACPCGSGKKYKRCCGRAGRRGSDDPLPLLLSFTEEERDAALTKLARYARADRFDADRQCASVLLFQGRLDDLDKNELMQVLEIDIVQQNFHNFFTIDMDCDEGRTILDCFLTERGSSLRAGERNYLDGLTRTCVRPFQIQDVVRDEGFHLLDLWSNEEQWVSERLATHALVRWDVIAARVMARPDGRQVLEGDLYVFPCAAKDRILQELRRAYRSFTKGNPDTQSSTFLKRCAAVVLGPIWTSVTLLRPTPSVVTPEGDEVEFGEGIFEVRDPVSLAHALDQSPYLQTESDGRWRWVEPVDEFERSLGVFVLEGQELRIETMSRRRMKRSRELLKAAVGDVVRHRVTRYQRPDLSSRSRISRAQQPQQPETPPEVERNLTRQMIDRHYHRWIDEPVPALGHRTPRDAASQESQRSRVADLLRQLENSEARRALETRGPVYDFGWLWRELGLDRDG